MPGQSAGGTRHVLVPMCSFFFLASFFFFRQRFAPGPSTAAGVESALYTASRARAWLCCSVSQLPRFLPRAWAHCTWCQTRSPLECSGTASKLMEAVPFLLFQQRAVAIGEAWLGVTYMSLWVCLKIGDLEWAAFPPFLFEATPKRTCTPTFLRRTLVRVSAKSHVQPRSEALSPAKFLELTPDPPDKSSVDFAEVGWDGKGRRGCTVVVLSSKVILWIQRLRSQRNEYKTDSSCFTWQDCDPRWLGFVNSR